MPSKLPIAIALLGLSVAASAAETEYLGMYLNGSKVGYASYQAMPAKLKGVKVTKTVSITEVSMKMMGTDTKIHMHDVSFADAKGHLLRIVSDQDSAGRTQHVEADFGLTTVKIQVDNSGTISHHTLKIPKGAKITDDPMEGLVFNKVKPGSSSIVYVLDPTTVAFVKTTITYKGAATVKVHNKSVAAEWIKIHDSRADSDVYCKPSGSIVKVEVPLGPLGIEMYPESRSVAQGGISSNSQVDLATGTKIPSQGDLGSPDGLKELKLQVTASSLDTLPTDDHQTVTHQGDVWNIDVHPPVAPTSSTTSISAAAAAQPDWIKPDVNIPSDTPRFTHLATKVVGGEKDVFKAARKVQSYVNGLMQPDASISVLRDANEVLDTHRGVCRDYAILTATLMRAAKIPTRLVTGLVSWDGDSGDFYYHAWVTVFDGKNWIGIDSTTSEPQISAAHVELASGTIAEAFSAPVLQHPTLKIEEAVSNRG